MADRLRESRRGGATTSKEQLLARRRVGEAAGPAVKASHTRRGFQEMKYPLILCSLPKHLPAKSARPDQFPLQQFPQQIVT